MNGYREYRRYKRISAGDAARCAFSELVHRGIIELFPPELDGSTIDDGPNPTE
jgi:hypothetical protein